MAPILRASLHGLRSSLCSQRPLKLPESNHLKRRWFAETAALDDTTQTVNDAASENGAASRGPDPPKAGSGVSENGAAKVAGNGVVSQESDSPLSSTDKLTNLILGKMRSKNISNVPRESSTAVSQASSVHFISGKPSEDSKEPSKVDKWDQVMVSMRNMAAKKREGSLNARPNASPKPPPLKSEDNEDDFADLDLPPGNLSQALSSSEKLSSTNEAFKSFISSSKPREGGKEKAKETKPVSFSFLKSLEAERTPSRPPNSNVGSHLSSSLKPKEVGLFESLTKDEKEGKPSMPESFDSPSNSLNSENLDSLKRSQDTLKQMKTLEAGYVVCVENVATHNHFASVKEALSCHGEVISSYKKPNATGSVNVFIEFKTAEAMDDALAARWVRVDSKAYGIIRVVAPCTTVVRLTKVSVSTGDGQVQALCEKFGRVDNVRNRGSGSYDVFFKPGELSNMVTILDSLNEVTVNQRRWIAQPAPLLHPSTKRNVLKSSEGQAWHANQLGQILMRIETRLSDVSISFEDLKALIAMEDEMKH